MTNNKTHQGGLTPLCKHVDVQQHAGLQDLPSLFNTHTSFTQVGSSSAGLDTDAGC